MKLSTKNRPTGRSRALSEDGRQKAGYIVIATFVLTAIVLCAVLAHRYILQYSKTAAIATEVNAEGVASEDSEHKDDTFEDDTFASFAAPDIAAPLVPLKANETLVATLSADIDGDTFQDQVLAVLPYSALSGAGVAVVFVRYDPASNIYTRITESNTAIAKANSFSFSAMDMTGDHNQEVVCHGTSANGDVVMIVFALRDDKVVRIGDFRADGSAFTAVVDRSEAYNQSQKAVEPFHVWTYGTSGGGELKVEWNYNAQNDKYVQVAQYHVAASAVAEREISRIRGTVGAFSDFLNGLWCRTTNGTDGERYVFFDKAAKEIIFLYQDTEELYTWGENALRGGGIYITATNAEIKTMRRRCDIAVTGTDEVRLRISDDVRMVIKEENQWDGIYRKKDALSYIRPDHTARIQTMMKTLVQCSPWQLDDNTSIEFGDGIYSFVNGSNVDSGAYALILVADATVLQFRSFANDNSALNENTQQVQHTIAMLAPSYTMELADGEAQTASSARTLHISPVTLSLGSAVPTNGRSYDFAASH